MKISVLQAPGPGEVRSEELDLAPGCCVRDALLAVGWEQQRLREGLSLSVWGRRATPDQVLAEGDRVELCRALQVDPKVARRERFKGQGARAAGLFATRRPGAKPGY